MAQTHTGSGTKSSKVNKAVGLKGPNSSSGDNKGNRSASSSRNSKPNVGTPTSTAKGPGAPSNSSQAGGLSAGSIGGDRSSSDKNKANQSSNQSKRTSSASYSSGSQADERSSSGFSATEAEYTLATNENHPNTVTSGAASGLSEEVAVTDQKRASGGSNQIAQQLNKLSGSLREHAEGQTGPIATVSERLASGIDSGSRYFQDKQPIDLKNSLADTVRRYPIPAAVLGLGLGFLLSTKLENRRL